ncbi:MAG: MBL fold metallo-hydrolase [Candidatus Aminicenantales bacterium]
MNKALMILAIAAAGVGALGAVFQNLETDRLRTSLGDLEISFVGHASLFFTFEGKVVHVDPCSSEGDYSQFPKADLILITHEHGDHLDPATVQRLRKPGTEVVVSEACAGKIPDSVVMKNGDRRTVQGLEIEAVPAYNVVNRRPDGSPFHPKGRGNGYVIGFGDKRVYVAGDTENIPEMTNLRNIDVAILPMNLPYTMTPEMVADAARTFRPKILYPYHFGKTDLTKLPALLANEPGIEIRFRRME